MFISVTKEIIIKLLFPILVTDEAQTRDRPNFQLGSIVLFHFDNINFIII